MDSISQRFRQLSNTKKKPTRHGKSWKANKLRQIKESTETFLSATYVNYNRKTSRIRYLIWCLGPQKSGFLSEQACQNLLNANTFATKTLVINEHSDFRASIPVFVLRLREKTQIVHYKNLTKGKLLEGLRDLYWRSFNMSTIQEGNLTEDIITLSTNARANNDADILIRRSGGLYKPIMMPAGDGATKHDKVLLGLDFGYKEQDVTELLQEVSADLGERHEVVKEAASEFLHTGKNPRLRELCLKGWQKRLKKEPRPTLSLKYRRMLAMDMLSMAPSVYDPEEDATMMIYSESAPLLQVPEKVGSRSAGILENQGQTEGSKQDCVLTACAEAAHLYALAEKAKGNMKVPLYPCSLFFKSEVRPAGKACRVVMLADMMGFLTLRNTQETAYKLTLGLNSGAASDLSSTHGGPMAPMYFTASTRALRNGTEYETELEKLKQWYASESDKGSYDTLTSRYLGLVSAIPILATTLENGREPLQESSDGWWYFQKAATINSIVPGVRAGGSDMFIPQKPSGYLNTSPGNNMTHRALVMSPVLFMTAHLVLINGEVMFTAYSKKCASLPDEETGCGHCREGTFKDFEGLIASRAELNDLTVSFFTGGDDFICYAGKNLPLMTFIDVYQERVFRQVVTSKVAPVMGSPDSKGEYDSASFLCTTIDEETGLPSTSAKRRLGKLFQSVQKTTYKGSALTTIGLMKLLSGGNSLLFDIGDEVEAAIREKEDSTYDDSFESHTTIDHKTLGGLPKEVDLVNGCQGLTKADVQFFCSPSSEVQSKAMIKALAKHLGCSANFEELTRRLSEHKN